MNPLKTCNMMRVSTAVLWLTGFLLPLTACDTGLTGPTQENQPPNTELSVQDSSLVDNIDEADRLQSTVSASWSGTDPDGYVSAFEIRYWPENESPPAPDAGWSRTTQNDSLILLPIPQGQDDANVVFQVRAIDDDSTHDPTPAETVFPIRNAPPTLRLLEREQPPDTTFPVFSFAWEADDPEGTESIDRIEISLNDSTSFSSLDPEIDFVTLVASEIDRSNAATTTIPAEIYAGNSFQNTGQTVPNLRLNAENTLYVRAVDQTDTTSTLARYSWYVRKPQSDVLFVNDYRSSAASTLQEYHLPILNGFLAGSADVWDLSYPTGGGRSALLPPAAEPTLRQTLALWDYIYWITNNATETVTGKNLPLAAGVMDLFFEQGGRLFVNTPTAPPISSTYTQENPAVPLLPMSGLLSRSPDTLQSLNIELPINASIEPAQPIPGLGETLPPLTASSSFTSLYPYPVGSNDIPLYTGAFRYEGSNGNERSWSGPSTLASISQDRQVGLLALPLLSEIFGTLRFEGADGSEEAPAEAIRLMLRGLSFPED